MKFVSWFTNSVRNEMFLKCLALCLFHFLKTDNPSKNALLKFRCREGAGLGEPLVGSSRIFFFPNHQVTPCYSLFSVDWNYILTRPKETDETLKKV